MHVRASPLPCARPPAVGGYAEEWMREIVAGLKDDADCSATYFLVLVQGVRLLPTHQGILFLRARYW